MNNEELFQWAQLLLTIASGLIIAYFTYKSNKSEKDNKIYREAREKLEVANRELEQKNRDDLTRNFKRIDEHLIRIDSAIENLQPLTGRLEKTDKKLQNLVNMSSASFEQYVSLGNVVSSIADSLEDNSNFDSDKIKIELEKHRMKERELVVKAYGTSQS